MNRSPSPHSIAAKADARLKALGNKSAAVRGRTYFKPDEEIWLYGVDAQSLRTLAREIYGDVAGCWSVEQAVRLSDILIQKKHLEPKGLGIEVLARYRRRFERGLLIKIRSWLEEGLCSNWAITDTLSIRVLAPLLSQFPELVAEVQCWAGSDSLWVRRAAAVSLVPLARRGACLDAAYAVAGSLFSDREDLIHKAIGWLLREAGKADPGRLRTFLLERGPQIPRTAIRYAIERFPPQERKALLVQTRSQH